MKQETLLDLLKKGFLVPPEAAGSDQSAEELIRRGRLIPIPSPSQPSAPTPEAHSTAPVPLAVPPKPAVTLRSRAAPPTLEAESVLAAQYEKYEALRAVLLRKADAVSINKAHAHGEATTIGMVRDPSATGFVLDDPTGWLEVACRDHGLAAGDIVAVSGPVREGRLFASQILLPDIPLTNAVRTLPGSIVLSQDSAQEPPDAALVSAAGLSGPAWLDVSAAGQSITLLAYAPASPLPREEAVLLLRKRSLPSEGPLGLASRPGLVMAAVPDIFWLISPGQWTDSYKGVTLVSALSARVDLHTREVRFL
jgi:hypothetical protein